MSLHLNDFNIFKIDRLLLSRATLLHFLIQKLRIWLFIILILILYDLLIIMDSLSLLLFILGLLDSIKVCSNEFKVLFVELLTDIKLVIDGL
jgi:hypothetical protein